LNTISDEDFQSVIRQKLVGTMQENGSRQKVIPLDGVEASVVQGWEYVATLPGERAIVKLPF